MMLLRLHSVCKEQDPSVPTPQATDNAPQPPLLPLLPPLLQPQLPLLC